MKKVLLFAAVATLLSGPVLADSYTINQQVIDPVFAINVAAMQTAPKVIQVAQNVGNTAVIKDLDGYGGDTYNSFQAVTAMQLARNSIDAHSVTVKVDQTAVNFGSDLFIKDAGGALLGPQSVNATQRQSGLQLALNLVDLDHSSPITQLAANTGNNMKIVLPSTTAINTVTTSQMVSAPQVSGNFIDVGGYTGAINQTAANLGNALVIQQ